MNKYLIFDMDGTIVDFYGVEGWKHYLDDLQDATPYRIAKPIYDMSILNGLLSQAKTAGWKIVVVSWLSRVKTDKDFHQRIIEAKDEWLDVQGFPYDEKIYLEYGTNKEEAVAHLEGIKVLFDDSNDVLDNWHGLKINAQYDIIPALRAIIMPQRLYLER